MPLGNCIVSVKGKRNDRGGRWCSTVGSVTANDCVMLAHRWPFTFIMKPDLPKTLSSRFSGIYQFLLNKWYFDGFMISSSVRHFGLDMLCGEKGDGAVIDGLGPNGMSSMVRRLSGKLLDCRVVSLSLCVRNDDWVSAFASWYILVWELT